MLHSAALIHPELEHFASIHCRLLEKNGKDLRAVKLDWVKGLGRKTSENVLEDICARHQFLRQRSPCLRCIVPLK